MQPVNKSLVALCFGNFIIGTGALIVPGMLPVLAEGLEVTLPVAGQLITAFAFTVCISAPLLAGATSRFDRRKLLASMQLLYVAGHLAAALLSSFAPLLAVRVITSFGAALFTAQAAATAALLVPPEKRGRAIAFVFIGWSLASVIGVSLGAYVGATLGWRAGFLLVAALACLGTAAVWLWLPEGLKVQPVDRRMWREILSHPVLLAVVAVTALLSAPQFAILSYIVPATTAFLDASPALVGLLLFFFGAMGVTGNVLSARLVDRLGAANVVMAAILCMLASHVLWPMAVGAMPVFLLILFLWGLGCFASNSAQQARLAGISPQHAPVAMALNTSAIYLGQAIGTAAGGVMLAQVPGIPGYRSLVWISIPLFLIAIGLSAFAARRAATR